jgi:hypothetical protein
MQKLLLNVFTKIFNTFLLSKKTTTEFTWKNICFLFLFFRQNFKKMSQGKYTQFDTSTMLMQYPHTMKFGSIHLRESPTLNSLLSTSLERLNLLFAFYIYKVDKQIYKNSRGKSGKYLFLWKYVAPYKRHKLIFYWLAKEARITNSTKMESRIFLVMNNFIKFISKSWIWRLKKFTLNYVYYNLRTTLSETYRTSIK